MVHKTTQGRLVHDQAGGLLEKMDPLVQKPDDVVMEANAASVAQGVVEDHADIHNAQAENREFRHISARRFSGLARV
jgi:hypothetical protein